MSKLNFGIKILVAVAFLSMNAGLVAAESNSQNSQSIGTDEKALISALQDENNGIRFSAVEALRTHIQNDNAKNQDLVKNALVNTLKNDNKSQIRIVAALTLMEYGSQDVFQILKDQAKNEKHKVVRTVLNGIVVQMKNEKALATKLQ